MLHSFWTRTAAFMLSLTLCAAGQLLPEIQSPAAAVSAADTLTDTGISYQETTETIQNPGMGYTTTLWYRCAPEKTEVKNPVGSIVLMFIDIGAFSVGENGKQDYPLDETFFNALRGTFQNCRENGSTIAVRFRYDDDGTRNPEPATFDALKAHIKQIGDSKILKDYADILMYVESGFVGCYGEQWGGKYCTPAQKAEVLDLLLDIVPDPIPVTVRTPDTFAQWAGIERKALAEWTSEKGSKAARIGLYDDGYMGSDSDLGTYADRAAETAWLGRQARTSYFGGEFSGDFDLALKYETYLPKNAIPEMYRTHLSYINSNIFKFYQDHKFGKECDVENVDNSAYYGQTAFKFIRDHLGYRFVIRDCKMTPQTTQGGDLSVQLAVENTGFANPVREQKAELLLEKDGIYYRTEIPLDTREWYSCQTAQVQQKIQLPGGLPAGDWNVYLKLSVGKQYVENLQMRSVRFANPDIWNPALAANYLGKVKVTENDDIALRCNQGTNGAMLYTLHEIPLMDGAISYTGEHGEPAAVSENGKLYLESDAKYLYLTAAYDAKADAAVHNFRFKNETNGETYWFYYQSNGFIYFNHDQKTQKMDSVTEKRGDGIVEFRIPYGELMGLDAGVKISNLRYFQQDSAHDWNVTSDVTLKETVTLEGKCHIYNAPVTVYLREGEPLQLISIDDAELGSQHQWCFNGKPLEGETVNGTTIKKPETGDYSVQLTDPSGAVREALICRVAAVYPAVQRGDINADGTVDTADAVLLQKYLLTADGHNPEKTALPAWKQGDINADGTLNALDLTLLKRLLLK